MVVEGIKDELTVHSLAETGHSVILLFVTSHFVHRWAIKTDIDILLIY